MENLPEGIIVNILSRLSLKPLFQCIGVCTTWHKIVLHDPHFAKMHLTRANQVHIPCLIYGTDSSSGKRSQLCLVDFNSEDNQDHTLKMVSKGSTGIRFDIGIEFRNVFSCNGLLCLCEPINNNPICVCNPVTGDHVILPKSTQCTHDSFFISGFGFDAINNEYKVIRMIYRMKFISDSQVEAEVYTLGSVVWRNIGSVPHLLLPKDWNHFGDHVQILIPNNMERIRPVDHNGAIHWMAARIFNGAYVELIMAWDVKDEKFRVIPQPVEFGPNIDYRGLCLRTYNNCLSIFDFKNLEFMNIWIMKDYNVKESWTKQIRSQKTFMNEWNMNENLITKARIQRWYLRWDALNHGADEEFIVKAVYNHGEKRFIEVEIIYLKDKVVRSRSVHWFKGCVVNTITHVGSFISVKNKNS